ncbi:DUF924 family protein [Pseudochrobactrum sp. HB0163]|uniref:DUF924 family protein n=1 Tax=Pseudochrobactrum sp. HB0163 TaxID=3450708 RepID=UPI003F6DCCBA
MAQPSPQEILDFWFLPATEAHWFVRSDDLDAQIKQRFYSVYEQAAAGELDQWREEARNALALTIILDQFPRNMFRGTPNAFATDAKAREIANYALDHAYDHRVNVKERAFFYLPLMHSENLPDQQRCVQLYEALGDDYALGFAREHRDIVQRFGRFPHRNAILGRENTAQEAEFLKTHKGF